MPTRYKRSNTTTVNDLLAYILGLTQSTTAVSIDITAYAYLRFRAFRRTAAGAETQIGSDVDWFIVANPSGVTTGYSFDWSCPQTALNTTDSIVVRMYGVATGVEDLLRTWQTEQTGQTQLDAGTWTYWVYTQYVARTATVNYRHGASTANSRIENVNFSTPAPPAAQPQMDGLVFIQ